MCVRVSGGWGGGGVTARPLRRCVCVCMCGCWCVCVGVGGGGGVRVRRCVGGWVGVKLSNLH